MCHCGCVHLNARANSGLFGELLLLSPLKKDEEVRFRQYPHYAPQVLAGVTSAGTSRKSTSSACAPIRPPKPTRKPCASGVCGWNPYSLRAKSGTACDAFATDELTSAFFNT